MQWMINSSSHNENMVLANQNKCHQNIQIGEFKKFGFFRAGHRLQMHNLLDALNTRSLSLRNLEVSLLIQQSLFECNMI